MMNIMEVNKRLRQRPPFQMIERVLELTPGESARGTKNVCINEPYFMGHFPDAPIMPGVLIIESCAQLSMMSTPGIIGASGKCPIKYGSFMHTFLVPLADSPGVSSRTLSIIWNGGLWRRRLLTSIMFIISLVLRLTRLPVLLYSLRHRCKGRTQVLPPH